MGRNGLVEIIRLSITPTVNRNSCRVARLVGMLTQGSVLRPQPWAGESQLRHSCCCLRSGQLGVLPIVYCAYEMDDINTKSRVADGGFTLVWTVVPTVGKRVFLRAVSTIPTVMRCMTPSAATVKKAASGRSKSPAFAGTKTAANRWPSPSLLKPLPMPSPRGGSSFLLCLRVLGEAPSPWGRLGWGLLALLPHGEGWDGALDGALDGASMPMLWCRCR